jgi:hypothetical protein
MRLSSFFSLVALSAAAEVVYYTEADSGVLARAIKPPPINCNVVVGVLALLKGLGNPATSFCSSYLQIGTVTVTVVITPPLRSVKLKRR